MRGITNGGRCIIISYYWDTDFIDSLLLRQEIQRSKVESEKRISDRGYNSYQLMRSIIISMFLRKSIDTLGIKYAYLFYKEIKGYKAPIPILKPHSLIISSTSKDRIKIILNRLYRRKKHL